MKRPIALLFLAGSPGGFHGERGTAVSPVKVPPSLPAPLLLILLGCSASTEPEWSRVPGLVVEGTAPFTSVVAPADVTRGQTFEITVSTFGSSSCTRPDGYELSQTASGAEIRVFDRVAPPNTPCTEDFHQFPRTVVLSFPAAGTIELAVVGRGFDQRPLTVRANVLVR